MQRDKMHVIASLPECYVIVTEPKYIVTLSA